MGYYTCYDLGVPKPTKDCRLTDEQIAEKLVEAFASLPYFEYESDKLRSLWARRKEQVDCEWLADAADAVNEVLFYPDNLKWYDYDKDMNSVSSGIPSVYFILYGDGEDSDDNWRSYFLNGRERRFNAVIPDQDMAAQVERELRPANYLSNGGF